MKKCTKGIILAGGKGSRLYPLTSATNKQLLPIYDKPAIYYPLTSLMLADIKDILIISTPDDTPAIESLLGDGSSFGISLHYMVQDSPKGLPEAFILGEEFIDGQPVAMILGDNLFYAQGLSRLLSECASSADTAHIFLYNVKDPSRYGVASFKGEELLEVVEKPKEYVSPWAVTGLYIFPGDVSEKAKSLTPSARSELEITDLIRLYISAKNITPNKLGRGYVWFDVGTPDALLQGSNFVEMLQNRQNLLIASPEEIAWRMGWLSDEQYKKIIQSFPNCSYKESLMTTLGS